MALVDCIYNVVVIAAVTGKEVRSGRGGEKVGGSTRTSFSWPGQSTIVAFPVVASTDLMCRSPDGCWCCSACGGTLGTGSFWFVTCANVGI